MKTRNILAVLHGEEVIESSGLAVDKKQRSLKKSEVRTMRSFYEIMTKEGCLIKHFDGFFVEAHQRRGEFHLFEGGHTIFQLFECN